VKQRNEIDFLISVKELFAKHNLNIYLWVNDIRAFLAASLSFPFIFPKCRE
jgi:hypothetical protein